MPVPRYDPVMQVIGIVGASALGKTPFIDPLIAALRIDGWTVSTIKRAPDGFDMDQPGKLSWGRREAGCREVMLVGGRRLVLMEEFGERNPPPLVELLARLTPVDIVVADGFQGATIPTIEVIVPGSGKAPRWPNDPNVVARVVALAADGVDVNADEAAMGGDCGDRAAGRAVPPRFAPADVAGLATFVAAQLGLKPAA